MQQYFNRDELAVKGTMYLDGMISKGEMLHYLASYLVVLETIQTDALYVNQPDFRLDNVRALH